MAAQQQRINRLPQAQKFIGAYAAFLKRQGKLPMYVYTTHLRSILMANDLQSRFVSIQRVKKKPESRNWGITSAC
jgi:hypothetical protein